MYKRFANMKKCFSIMRPLLPLSSQSLIAVIAVSVAHFRPENQRMKLTFISIAIVLGLVAASGTILGQYILVTKQTTEANNRS
jgi:hypothetical protein